MFILTLLVLTSVNWTQQHLTYPINYCNLASACVHDSHMVCASTPDGCSRKSFLDQCDMYEFNCDYGTRYQETYTLFCMNSDMVVPYLDPNPITSRITFSLIEPTSTNSASFTTPTTNTLITQKSTTKKFTTLIPTTIQDRTAKTATISKSDTASTELRTTTITNKAEITPTISETFINCCDRPKTWETTKVEKENSFMLSTLLKRIIKMTKTHSTLPFTKRITTPYLSKTTRTTFKISDNTHSTITKYSNSTLSKILTTASTISSTYTAKTTIHPSTTYSRSNFVTTNFGDHSSPCCHRPNTWETTTELTIIIPIEVTLHDTLYRSTTKLPGSKAVTASFLNDKKTKTLSETTTKELPVKTAESQTNIKSKKTQVWTAAVPTTSTEPSISLEQTISIEPSATTVIYRTRERIFSSKLNIISILSTNSSTSPTKMIKNSTILSTSTLKSTNTETTRLIEDTQTVKTNFNKKKEQLKFVIHSTVPNCKKCELPVTWITTTKRRKGNNYNGYHY